MTEQILKEVAQSRARNSLIWAGFSISNTAVFLGLALPNVINNSILELPTLTILLGGMLPGLSWVFYDCVYSPFELFNKLRFQRQEIYFFKIAEILHIVGVGFWAFGISLYLEIYELFRLAYWWKISLLIIFLIGVPPYFLRKWSLQGN